MSNRSFSRRGFLKTAAAASGTLAFGPLLQACAPATPAATSAPTSAPAATSVPTSAPAPTSVPEVKTITFWHQWGGTRTELLGAEIGKFEAANPDIKVDAVLHGWDEWPTEQLTAVAGGDPPELALGGGIYVPEFASSDALVPLGPLLKAEGIDVKQILYPSDYELATWQGEVWQLPMTKNGALNIMYYNKTMFEAAGLDPEKPPATWAELETAAQAITKVEGGQLVQNAISIYAGPDDFKHWLMTNGAEWLSADGQKALFNSPAAVETLDWMVNFVDSIYGGWEVAAVTSAEDLQTSFYNSKEAMLITGSWMFRLIQDNAATIYESMGVAARPRNKGKYIGGVVGDDVSMWILKGSKNPEAAWKLLKYLTIGEGGCDFMKIQIRPSPVRACSEDSYFKEQNPWWDTVLQILELEIPFPRSRVNPQITQLTGQAVEEALFHRATPQEALDKAVEEAQKLLDEAAI